MTASASRRRNLTIAAAVSGVLVLGAAPVLGYAGWQVLKDSEAGTQVETLPLVPFPSTPTAMIAVVDDAQVVTAVAVLVMSPAAGAESSAVGGTIVSLPTSANTAQSDEDASPLSASLALAGEEGLLASVESVTRLTVNHPAVFTEDEMTAWLTRIGPVQVNLPNDVVSVDADGAAETLFSAGEHTLQPADVAAVLVARDPSQSEARRLPNIRQIWNAISAGVGSGLAPRAELTPTVTDFEDYTNHFLGGTVQVYNDLDTSPVPAADNPDGLDVTNLNLASTLVLMASIAPSAMITPFETLNFRIENGLTQADIDAAGLVDVTPADVTRDMVSRVLFLHGNIVSVSAAVNTIEPKTVPDVTVVLTEDGVRSSELDVITTFLGQLEFESPRFVYPLIDVVVVVGKSYLADMATLQASATGDTGPSTSVASDSSSASTPETVDTVSS